MGRVLRLMCPNHVRFCLRTSSINGVSPVISLSSLIGYNWRTHYIERIHKVSGPLGLTVCLIVWCRYLQCQSVWNYMNGWDCVTVLTHLYHRYWKLYDKRVYIIYSTCVSTWYVNSLERTRYDWQVLHWFVVTRRVSLWSSVTLRGQNYTYLGYMSVTSRGHD